MNRKALAVFSMGFGLMASATTARAGGGIPFSYTAPGGAIPQHGTDMGFGNYPLFMNADDWSGVGPAPASPLPFLTSLELVLTDLTHTHPQDLDIYLISPFGESIEIMTDKGDGISVNGLDIVFSDLGSSLPDDGSGLGSGPYRPEDSTGPGSGTGFFRYFGNSGGTDAWELIIIDDAGGDFGSLGSYTLRGTYVPEPASLALLGMGAVAVLRRTRRTQ